MKVLQILPELNSGGVERGTLEVADYLVKQGHQSLVISNGGGLVAQLEEQGSRHLTMPVHRKSLFSLRQVAPLRRVLREEAPDLLHVRSRMPAWLTWLAWKKLDPRSRPALVTTMHGLFSVNFYSRIMTRGQRIIAISETCRRYILEHYPRTDPDAIRVIPRGIDPAYFRSGYQPENSWLERWRSDHPGLAEKFVVTLPGRMTHKKGQSDLIKVVALLKESGVPAHGLLVGSTHPRKAHYLDSLRVLARKEGIEEDLTILEHRNDLREIMSVSDVVVALTHKPEAFGRVALEGLCLGKPVAAYAHGGLKEQLDYFFPEGAVKPNDPEACAALLASWCKNGPPVPEPKTDHPFTLQAMLESTLAVYDELLSSR